MKLKGILRGNTIGLSEAIDLPDGTEVWVEVIKQPVAIPKILVTRMDASQSSFNERNSRND